MALVNRTGESSPLVHLERTLPDIEFVDVASDAGLNFEHVAGDRADKQYILEVTGSGVAIFDYNDDGLQDVFLLNQTRWPAEKGKDFPTSRLFRNLGNLEFEDVTSEARLLHQGWGQGTCVGDYDNDGDDDLFITNWGENALYRNAGDGTFEKPACGEESIAGAADAPSWTMTGTAG